RADAVRVVETLTAILTPHLKS
ncbi:MAG: hypothetical protein RLZZ15_1435, partial [Verrucomicrobiota bacterium]